MNAMTDTINKWQLKGFPKFYSTKFVIVQCAYNNDGDTLENRFVAYELKRSE